MNVGLERHQPRVAIRLPEQVELHGVQFPRREGNPQNSLQACAVELLHQQVCTISFTGIWCFESYFVPLKRPFYRNPSILKRERENKVLKYSVPHLQVRLYWLISNELADI